MFRKSKAAEIGRFFEPSLAKNELALFYLGTSGFITRTANHAVLIDPAGFLKDDEMAAIKGVNLLLFTHNHLDHFNSGKTQGLFKATGAAILAEAKIVDKLKGKIPENKLTKAESGKTYTFGDVTSTAVVGIHRGPIMLYQIKLDGVVLFHAGDSGYVTLKDYPSDVALLPTGRMSPTASPENAYKMAFDLKPSWVVAMHGSAKQHQQFASKVKSGLPQATVLIMEPYTSSTIMVKEKA
jgi:L-ascorbate metabolism protein UlaG (beta-lactamase superfamily)